MQAYQRYMYNSLIHTVGSAHCLSWSWHPHPCEYTYSTGRQTHRHTRQTNRLTITYRQQKDRQFNKQLKDKQIQTISKQTDILVHTLLTVHHRQPGTHISQPTDTQTDSTHIPLTDSQIQTLSQPTDRHTDSIHIPLTDSQLQTLSLNQQTHRQTLLTRHWQSDTDILTTNRQINRSFTL